MRFGGGFGRACALLGATILTISLAGCLGAGPQPQPQQYALGTAGDTVAEAPNEDVSAKETHKAPGSRADAFAQLPSNVIYFATDSSELSPDAKATLRKQIGWLKKHPRVRLLIEGHADDGGSQQYNFMLGAERAVAVKTYLENNGLKAASIPTISYGTERPLADCDSASCQAQNRRAQTIVTSPIAMR
ncbi:MAG: OmpA family protein [Pseudomonadota bacterium]